MALRIICLPVLFRPKTSHVYPPFVHGRYMEEYIYDELVSRAEEIFTDWVYIPVFWTNLQNHPAFSIQRGKYQMLLNQAIRMYPADTKFFTCVQHDDGVMLTLPAQTVIYGACTGDVPLPLIYEDTTERLLQESRLDIREKDVLGSFVGTVGTHTVRGDMCRVLQGKPNMVFTSRPTWSPSVPVEDAERFIDTTRRSRFCLAPRGYGRSSFRFVEAMRLGVVPVYIWDDVEWLPYPDLIKSREIPFYLSVHVSELDSMYDRLRSIGDEEYANMVAEIERVMPLFTLKGMCQWLVTDVIQRSKK